MMSYSHILLNAWPFTPIDGQCKTSTPFHKKLMLSTLWLVVWSWSNFYFICFKVGYAEHSEMQADKKCPCEFRIYFFKQCCGHMTLWCHSCFPLIWYECYSHIFNQYCIYLQHNHAVLMNLNLSVKLMFVNK